MELSRPVTAPQFTAPQFGESHVQSRHCCLHFTISEAEEVKSQKPPLSWWQCLFPRAMACLIGPFPAIF